MHIGTSVIAFKRALRKSGEKIAVRLNDKTLRTRAIVQNTGVNFMRKYDNGEKEVHILGRDISRNKLAFVPYFEEWDDADGEIVVLYRNKSYQVVTDSVVYLGDKPFYVWAILTEIVRNQGVYYDDTDE